MFWKLLTYAYIFTQNLSNTMYIYDINSSALTLPLAIAIVRTQSSTMPLAETICITAR
jgi:hypothetical protein